MKLLPRWLYNEIRYYPRRVQLQGSFWVWGKARKLRQNRAKRAKQRLVGRRKFDQSRTVQRWKRFIKTGHCWSCGSRENLTLDHIKPLAKGGTNELKNLQILCYFCNNAKDNSSPKLSIIHLRASSPTGIMKGMNKELAKKLKDAGFPTNGQTLWRGGKDLEWGELLPFPALSELIEACMEIITKHNSLRGEKWFFSLSPNIITDDWDKMGTVSDWRAGLDRGENLDEINFGSNYFGDTPEEAVAELWLALKNENEK